LFLSSGKVLETDDRLTVLVDPLLVSVVPSARLELVVGERRMTGDTVHDRHRGICSIAKTVANKMMGVVAGMSRTWRGKKVLGRIFSGDVGETGSRDGVDDEFWADVSGHGDVW
jgi:hypothetical protein